MPVSYRIDLNQEIVYVTADGILTDDNLKKFVNNLLRDDDFHPSLNALAITEPLNRSN